MRSIDLCPPPHLTAADLNDSDVEVTIKSVGFAEVGEAKDTKGVVYFEEFTRGMVVNSTNRQRIEGWHGLETDDWIGKKITLYPSETEFGGKTVECIRVRPKK